jgi:hypothetical protein
LFLDLSAPRTAAHALSRNNAHVIAAISRLKGLFLDLIAPRTAARALSRNNAHVIAAISRLKGLFLDLIAPRTAARALQSNRPQNGAWIAGSCKAIALLLRGPRSALCGL